MGLYIRTLPVTVSELIVHIKSRTGVNVILTREFDRFVDGKRTYKYIAYLEKNENKCYFTHDERRTTGATLSRFLMDVMHEVRLIK